jgi:DNA polymerase IV
MSIANFPAKVSESRATLSMRKILHIDMDAFYASIEQKDHPFLRGKPLIVGGDPQGRGVVAACSYEARKFGIRSAMPCKRAVKLCPQAIFTPPRMERYVEISSSIMEMFRRYTPLVEPLSLDEAFLDVTDLGTLYPSATHLAAKICREIYETLGLTASAGVSFNKFLAKVASAYNKPRGLTTVTPVDAQRFIDALSIRKFFGVGEVTEKKMLRLGITNGAQLRRWKEEDLILHFGKIGTFLHDIVHGIDDRPVEPSRLRKSIGSETTLSRDTADIKEINGILATLAQDIEDTLRRKGKVGHTLTLKVRYDDFVTITRSTTTRNTLGTTAEILSQVPQLLARTSAGTRKVRLLGLSLARLCEESSRPRQLKLPFMDEI